LVPHTGDAVCTVCGAAFESWLESTHVPKYELIEHHDQAQMMVVWLASGTRRRAFSCLRASAKLRGSRLGQII
jgi:hypothetical protein